MPFQIAICDDYSLPVDFVKKRPSSFDPCLAEAIPANPEHWIAPSPQTEFVSPCSLSGLSGWLVGPIEMVALARWRGNGN